jgi:predicted acyltransferase (DUF342 family)
MRNKSGLMRDEKGQILIWVIALMMLAALIIPPFLASAYAGVHTSKVRQERMQELYAADTGIEDALNWIRNDGNFSKPDLYDPYGNSTFPPGNSSTAESAEYILSDWSDATNLWIPKLVNNCEVKVKVERDVSDYPEGNYTYFVYSTATNQDTGTHVTVRVHCTEEWTVVSWTTPDPILIKEGGVSNNPFSYAIGSLQGGAVLNSKQGVIEGDVYVNGAVNLIGGQNIINGNVYSVGDLRLQQQSAIKGNASVSGNIFLEEASIIEQNAWGNKSITLSGKNGIWGNASAQTDINVNSGSINGFAKANHDVNVSSVINQSAWANHDINVNGGKIEGWAYYLNSLNISKGGSVGNSSDLGDYPDDAVYVRQPILPQVEAPLDPDAAYWGNASTGPTLPSQTIKAKGSPVSLGPCVVNGSLQVENNGKLILTGTVYVLGTINLAPGGNISTSIPPPTTPAALVATGNITLKSNILVQPGQVMPLIMSVNGDITCWTNCEIWAALYAPNGSVYLKNGSYVNGAVVAQRIAPEQGQQSQYTIVYNEAVTDIPGLPYADIPVEEEDEWYQPPDVPNETPGVSVDSYIVLKG